MSPDGLIAGSHVGAGVLRADSTLSHRREHFVQLRPITRPSAIPEIVATTIGFATADLRSGDSDARTG